MATVTDSDLKEIKDILAGIQGQMNDLKISVGRVEANQARTDEKLNSIDNRMVRLETKLETLEPSIQKIPDLSEKVGELKNWKQVGLIIVTAMVSSVFSGTIGGVIGWLIRGGRV
jgi:archaellum component FlaC